MALSRVAARLRIPTVVVVSIAAIVGTAIVPGGVVAERKVVSQRIIATPKPVKVFTPSTMSIPAIDITDPIVPVGTEPDGKMGAPKRARDIGWWAGRKPGQGNALFAAHHDWSGALGSFYRLKDLKPGDKIIVKGEGRSATYRIMWVKNYDRNIDAEKLLGNDSKKQIATLITCGGVFDSSAGTHKERVVAQAELLTA